MIKNIAYFPSQCALNSTPVMSAFLNSCTEAGISIEENSLSADAAVIWSVLWNGRMKENKQVYEHYRTQGKPVIVIDVGALDRGRTWKVAINNVNARGYYGHLENLDWDRPKLLGVSLSTVTNVKPHIVIAAQHDRSLQMDGVDISQWITTTIKLIKNNSDRPIVVRPHPRSKLSLKHLPSGVTVEQPNKLANTYDSYDMHFDCHAVVNYSSSPGIQAAIAGVRPIVEFSSLAYPVSVGYADIEQPYTKDRELWFTQICHTEYTVDEIQKGLWLTRLSPML